MSDTNNVDVFYQQRIKELSFTLHEVNEKRSRIAWLRLFIILVAFSLLYKTWNYVPVWMLIFEVALAFAAFLYVLSIDTDTKEKMINLQHLIAINEEEIKINNSDYGHRESGVEYLPSRHDYAEDLDVFGKNSLYQYINRCSSQQGKKLMANRLLHSSTKETIETEQAAITDLKSHIAFIQQFQAIGLTEQITTKTEKNIKEWLDMPVSFGNKTWFFLATLFPCFTISLIFLYIADIISSGLFSFIVLLCYLISTFISRKISSTYDILSKLSAEIDTLQKQLFHIEKEVLNSKKAIHLQQQLKNNKDKVISAKIKKLYSILNRFDMRLNHFAFFFVNTLFLWDLHQLLALNKWKQHNKTSVANWFAAIAEMEYSCSLAVLSFNHPDWCMPVISDQFFELSGNEIGHPLLNEKNRVDNSFSLEGKGKVSIITGSNMGGKSTFLRSLGVNTVLALIGAPVCAQSFSVSVMQIMSSMRVTDNLSENTSTFYAELKKLKTIIQAANEGQRIFILLDEILRGTNSLDRHVGSVALLKQLIQKEAVAIIATHDVDLAKLEEEFPDQIANYHFDVQAEGNELYFDYKLKKGICKSLNASILMKNIGIELE